MLQPLYGLNQPYNTACTPSRTALSSSATFVPGNFVKLTNGKVELAAVPADGPGSEIAWEPNDRNWSGTVPTIMGILEALTDQYNKSATIVDKTPLVTRAGILDAAANDTEAAFAIGFSIGAPAGGVLHFKRTRA